MWVWCGGGVSIFDGVEEGGKGKHGVNGREFGRFGRVSTCAAVHVLHVWPFFMVSCAYPNSRNDDCLIIAELSTWYRGRRSML